MAATASLRSNFYRIPLPVVLTDSTHGEMTSFELITVRIVDGDGAEGVGYTYTVGGGGGAIHDMIQRDLTPVLLGQPTGNIEALWQKMWWALHYGGRGGQSVSAISAVDVSLWDLRAKHAHLPVTSHGAHDITVHLLAAAPNRSYLEAHGRDRRRVVADNTVFHARGRESKILVPIIPLEPSHP